MTHAFHSTFAGRAWFAASILALGLSWIAQPLFAQSAYVFQDSATDSMEDRVRALESELQSLREALGSGSPDAAVPDPAAGGAVGTTPGNCCRRCGCASSCLCPLDPAPCIDCPRVSTLGPNFNVSLFGTVTLDMVFSQPRTIAPGTPFFLATASQQNFDENTVSFHARQSSVGAALAGPQFGAWKSGGLVLVNFFNDAVIVDQYGVLPLQAYGELRNDRWRVSAGLQFDVFSPGAPTVLPFSFLSASGNAGNSFRGQLRLERYFNLSDNVQWLGQVALSEPVATTINPEFRLLEDNGWPNVEGRVAVGIGQPELVAGAMRRPFELGTSGVVGQLRTTLPAQSQIVTDVWGAGIDFRWKFLPFMGVAGEVFKGKGIGTYNAGVLQNVNTDLLNPANSTFEAIETAGGWLETFVYWTPCLHSHVGYGIDDPTDSDLGIGQRRENSTYFGNILWDVNPSLRLGFEFTWRETKYNSPVPLDNEGAGFHTQMQWAF